MRIGNIAKSGLLAAVLTGACATMDESKDWVDIKDPNELRAIYSDKTLNGYVTFDFSRPWVLYSRADGKGVIHFDGRQYDMTWEVSSDDQVCTKRPGNSTCYRFQKHRTRPGVYRAYNLSTQQYGGEITVQNGIPKS